MTIYFLDDAVGNDGNAGTSEGAGNAWLTVDKALSTVVAGDKVWVKDSGIYSEDAALDTPGTNISPIIMEGYATTTGDGGKATIAAVSVSCILIGAITASGNHHYGWRNFIFDGAGGSGTAYSTGAADSLTFINSEFINAGNVGLAADNQILCYKCIFDNNAAVGALTDVAIFIASRFSNNGASLTQAQIEKGLFIFCEAYGGINGQAAMRFDASTWPVGTINCTLDGENTTTSIAVLFDGNNMPGPAICINNIIYDFATGVRVDTAFGEMQVIGHNLLNSNSVADYAGGAQNTIGGDVTGAPVFTDEPGDDYSLNRGSSPAVDAGTDAEDLP